VALELIAILKFYSPNILQAFERIRRAPWYTVYHGIGIWEMPRSTRRIWRGVYKTPLHVGSHESRPYISVERKCSGVIDASRQMQTR
jgi:hypothetical protein